MLSRIAESLFWIGRYVERADDTARILDAFLTRLLEDPWADHDARCRAQAAILGAPAPADEPMTIDDLLDRLAYDQGVPCSIGGAVTAARENAKGSRDVISSEVWECLNVTRQALPAQRRAAGRLGPAVYLSYIKERTAVLAGLTESTMRRDDGWRFLILGRSLERVDMTARLLSMQLGAAADDPGWRSVLRSCGAYESFLHTRGGAVLAGEVTEFLLLDPLFPRSALHALTVAEQCLRELLPPNGRSGSADHALRPIGRIRTTLEYVEASALHLELGSLLHALQQACIAASEEITDRCFAQAAPISWGRLPK